MKKYKFTKKNQFQIDKFKTNDKGEFQDRSEALSEFVDNLNKINLLQQKLYAERKESIIFIFQAMDAAGKDGCIRTVFSTLTPHGVKEFCFKAPSMEELSHDYLWRFWSALPAKGHISIFNRSYYEDVLVGKVHKLYENQLIPARLEGVDVIEKRYQEIVDFEKYLHNNGTRVVKIFLNVSKNEQAKRFISRIDTPRKNWKVSEGDIKEREYWDEYQEAFESMINKTSTKNSPWYVVPADHKWYARLVVSRIVLKELEEINPKFPKLDKETQENLAKYKKELLNSLPEKERLKVLNKKKAVAPKQKAKTLKCKKIECDVHIPAPEFDNPPNAVFNDLTEEWTAIEEEGLKLGVIAEKSNNKLTDDISQECTHSISKKEKKQKKKERKEKEMYQDLLEEPNAFVNAVDVVIDAYIAEELEKEERKNEEIFPEMIVDDNYDDLFAETINQNSDFLTDKQASNLLDLNIMANDNNELIEKILSGMNIPSDTKGYTYLQESLLMLSNNTDFNDYSKMYSEIAKKYKCAAKNIKSVIYSTIAIAWEQEELTDIQKTLFNDKKPSVTEFFNKIKSYL